MLIPKDVAAVAKVAASEEQRYAIHGVKLERNGKGPRALATDGKRGLIVRWKEPEGAPDGDFSANVGAKGLQNAARLVKYRKGDPDLARFINVEERDYPDDWAKSVPYCSVDKGEPIKGDMVTVEGRFPPLDEVIPAADRDGTTFHVNANLLIGLLQAMVKATGSEIVKVQIAKPKDAIRIDSTDIDSNPLEEVNATGVLMPISI